jgi:proline racemase
MSKTGRPNHRRGTRGTPKPERQITVRSVRRDPPDLRKLSRAVIAMALRDAEAEAEARQALTITEPAKTDSSPTSTGDHPEPAND